MAERPTYYDFVRGLASRMMGEYISANAQLLYHTLLMVNNQAHWEEWFPCTDYYITNLMHMGVSAMKNARNDLKQLGAIDFTTSKKRGECTRYRVCDEFCTTVCTYQTNVQTTQQTEEQTALQTYNKSNNKPHTNKDKRYKTKNKTEDNNPLTPFEGELGLKVGEWLTYKKEKGQAYKPTGLKQLIAKIEKHVSQYGERAVIDALDTAMANSWQGFFVKPSSGPDYEVNRDRGGFDYGSIDDIMREKYDGG